MIDLHTHSTASDGTYSPTALVELAAQTGVSVLALTDHDTTAGIAEASAAGERYGVTVIPGIEISIEWQPGELHLLGLGIDPENTHLKSLIAHAQQKRIERNNAMIQLFRLSGIPIDEAALTGIAGGKIVGRPHFAQYLVQIRKAKNIRDAFDRYLGKGRPCYIDKETVSLEEGIQVVCRAGGVPVLAHPMSLYLSWAKLPVAIEDFKKKGLAGLEAWHSAARYGECVRLEQLAADLDLIVTAGSDFHGSLRQERKLGKTVRNMPIDDRFYTANLLPALQKIRHCGAAAGS